MGRVEANLTVQWPRRFRTFWCVIDSQGTAYLVSARTRRSKSIAAFVQDASKNRWPWWRRYGYSCQRVDIKVRNSAKVSPHGR